jgi:hypothetical protein
MASGRTGAWSRRRLFPSPPLCPQARRRTLAGPCLPTLILLVAIATIIPPGVMAGRGLHQHADAQPHTPAPSGSVAIIVNSPAASCPAHGTGLMDATQTSVEITQGISAPTGMVCTDVPVLPVLSAAGGLVLQVAFARQSDAVAFYNSLTDANGINFWIVNARSTNDLPCNTTVLVYLNQYVLSQFSCTPNQLAAPVIPAGAAALCCTPSPLPAPSAGVGTVLAGAPPPPPPVDFPHSCLPGNSAINGGVSAVPTETAGFAFTVYLTNVTNSSYEVNIRPNLSCEPLLSGRFDCCNAQFKKTEFVIGNNCVNAIATVESPGPSIPRQVVQVSRVRSPSYLLRALGRVGMGRES